MFLYFGIHGNGGGIGTVGVVWPCLFRPTDCLVVPDSRGKGKSDSTRGKPLSRNRKSRGGGKTVGFH